MLAIVNLWGGLMPFSSTVYLFLLVAINTSDANEQKGDGFSVTLNNHV